MKINNKKKIVIFTGNRAEYGLLSPIIRELNLSNKFKTTLLVSGSHLEKDYGLTLNEIRSDGYNYEN